MSQDTPGSYSATSASLLERVRANEAQGWEQLVHLYAPLVFSWCQRAGLSHEDAADTLQEVWKSVTGHIGRFEPQVGSFRGWLWTITRNKLHDHFRSRQGKPAATGGSEARQFLENIAENEPREEAGVLDDGLLHRTLELIRPEFEEKTWRAFWRMTVDGVPASDAGAELGLSANGAHQAKFRVLRRLRRQMEGLMEIPEAASPA